MNLFVFLFQATLRSQLQATEQRLQQESIFEGFGIWNGRVLFSVSLLLSTRCVCFFVFVHFLFCHLLLYACPFVFFHVFVYESTLIVSFTFIGLFSVSNF